MRKIFKLSTLLLSGLLVFTGCSKMDEEEGKKWALENGYVKKETRNEKYKGEYKFKALFDESRMYLEANEDMDTDVLNIYGGFNKMKIKLDGEKMSFIESKVPEFDGKYYFISHDNNIYFSDKLDGSYDIISHDWMYYFSGDELHILLTDDDNNFDVVFEKTTGAEG